MSNTKELNERINDLKKIDIFSDISDNEKDIKAIAELFKNVSYSKGSEVITEGKSGNNIFIIKNGTVEILKRTLQKELYTVAELSSEMNVFFGEIGLIDSDKRSATVICKTDCEFYMLERERFIKFGDQNPRIALSVTRNISKLLCRRLRKANSDIITLFDALVEEVGMSGGIVD